MRRLGEEFKNSGKRKESLGYYLKYIRLPEEKITNKEYNKEVYYYIAALYSDEKQYVNSMPYYEKYLSLVQDSKEKELAFFQLGEFSIKRLGNLEACNNYFQKWLELSQSENLDSMNSDHVLEVLKKRVTAYFGISKYKRFMKKPVEEDSYLEKTYLTYQDIMKRTQFQKENLAKSKQAVLELKKVLLQNSNEQDLTIYREEENKVFELEKNLEEWYIQTKGLPRVEILLRLAHREETKKDFIKAKFYYRELMELGTETERNLALRNIIRIDKILNDGIPREIILQ